MEAIKTEEEVGKMKIDHKRQRLTTRRIIVKNKMKLIKMVVLVAQNTNKTAVSKIKILGSTNTTTSKDLSIPKLSSQKTLRSPRCQAKMKG